MAILMQKEASAEQILFYWCPKGRRAIVTAILRCVHSTSCDVHSLAHSLICFSYYNICFLRFKVSVSVRLSSYPMTGQGKFCFPRKTQITLFFSFIMRNVYVTSQLRKKDASHSVYRNISQFREGWSEAMN